MISISTTTANVMIKENLASDTGAKTARISRTATLDGGVYINHSGFTHGDRTLRIKAKITVAQGAVLTTMFQDKTSALISIRDGIYLGAISALNTQNGKLSMTFLIKDKEY